MRHMATWRWAWGWWVVLLSIMPVVGSFPAVRADTYVLYVAVDGDDAWSGTLPVPNAQGTDGPLASLIGARDKIRTLKTTTGLTAPVEVQVRGGVYYETPTLYLTYLDSGTAEFPITYKAYGQEKPVFSGGRVITGLSPDAGGRYVVVIPEAAGHAWKFRQLFIDDERYTLARSPNEGYYYVTGIPPEPPSPYYDEPYWYCHNFYYRPGDLQNWATLADGDINLVVYHLWEASTVLLTSVNEADNSAFTATHVLWGLNPHEQIDAGGLSKRYIVENAPDALDAPGEWYLDRTTGQLTVIPRNGENLAVATVVAPVTRTAVQLTANADAGYFVEYIRFEGLTFRHFAAPSLNGGLNGGWQSHQGAHTIPACIEADSARYISISGCEISHIGTHALRFGRGCSYNTVEQNHLYDLGGGGVYLGETVYPPENYDPGTNGLTHHNTIYNNYIHDGGLLHPGAMGILVGQSSDNTITHNEIAFFNQTGIQLGWTWSTADTWHKRNLVAYNYIHDIGQNVLSDLGGIYTLGQSDGTVIRNNLIHDVWCWIEDNGKGIYPDENSHNITYENNITYNTGASGFGINYARDLTVRNNIFALNYNQSPFKFGWGARCVIRNNIFYYLGGDVYGANQNDILDASWFTACDNNLFWRVGGKRGRFLEIPAYAFPVAAADRARSEFPNRRSPSCRSAARGFYAET